MYVLRQKRFDESAADVENIFIVCLRIIMEKKNFRDKLQKREIDRLIIIVSSNNNVIWLRISYKRPLEFFSYKNVE